MSESGVIDPIRRPLPERARRPVGRTLRRSAATGLPPRWWSLVALLACVGHLPATALSILALGAALCSVMGVGLTLTRMPPRFWLPLVGCAAVGLSGAGAWVTRDVLRDLWLMGSPLCLIFYGWTLVRRHADLRHLFDAVILGATVWSTVHLLSALQNLDLLADSRDAFRQVAGSGSLLPALALYMLFAGRISRSGAPNGRRWRDLPCAALCLLSMAISLSRTWWIVLLMLLLVACWLRIGGLRTTFAGALLCCASLIGLELAGGGSSSPSMLAGAFEDGFRETLSARNLVSQKDLNEFWRNYEAYRVVETLRELPRSALIFGTGLGTQLDLGLYQLLDGQYRRFIPILHNGYLYVTLKAGAVGLLLYLTWILVWVREGLSFARSRGPWVRLVGGLVMGLALSLVLTSQVIGGAFNVSASFALFVVLGAAARWMHLTRHAAVEVSA